MYKVKKRGYNDTSQKIRKYLSSPKEAFRTAETAVLGASAMFRGFKLGSISGSFRMKFSSNVLPNLCSSHGIGNAFSVAINSFDNIMQT